MNEVVSAAPPPTARRARISRRAARLLVALLATAGMLGAGDLAAAGATQRGTAFPIAANDDNEILTWGLQPVQKEGEPFRANLVYEAKPGDELKDKVRLRNYSPRKIPLTIFAGDAYNSEGGPIDVQPTGATPTDVGSWISLDTTELELQDNDIFDVEVTIKVPKDAEPGDHTGGIVSSFVGPGSDSDGKAVMLDRRIGTRVQIRVAGDLKPKLAISNLHVGYKNTANPLGRGSLTATYTVKNVGNVRLGANQVIKVKSPVGLPARTFRPSEIAELLPGNAVKLATKMDGVWPTVRSKTSVTLTAVPRLQGDNFNVTAAGAAASSAVWSWPWAFALLLALLALGLRARQVMRKRREEANARELKSLVDSRLGEAMAGAREPGERGTGEFQDPSRSG